MCSACLWRRVVCLPNVHTALALPHSIPSSFARTEPRDSVALVTRTADVIRNVGVLLNTPALGGDCSGVGAPKSEAQFGWSIQFFHGSTNVEAVAAHFSAEEWGRVGLVSLGVSNLHSSQEYSDLLTSHWFWSRVGAEQVLIFQEDALLCGPPVHSFAYAYSYCGAPWDSCDGWVRGKPWLSNVGGNGGLSLRRRSHSIQCLDAVSLQQGQWEDAYFVEALQCLGHAVAPAEAARDFAVERILSMAPCGLHKAYNYQDASTLRGLLQGLERHYAALTRELV